MHFKINIEYMMGEFTLAQDSIFFRFMFLYMGINIYCFVMAIVLYTKISDDIRRSIEVKKFKKIILIYLIYVCTNSVWMLYQYDCIENVLYIAIFSAILAQSLMTIMCFCWFMLGELLMQKQWIYSFRYRALAFIPAFVGICLFITSPQTGFILEIDEDGHFHHGKYYFLQLFIDALYGVGITIIALYRITKTHLISVKKECWMVFVFVFPVLTGAIVDMIIPSMPVIVPSILASLVILFTNICESRINNDALTGMNNRRRTDQYLEEQIASSSEIHPFYFFLGDVNSFKQINDTYGHLEGDRALKIVADALKSISNVQHLFCARWAGDEFVVIADAGKIDHPEQFIKAVQARLLLLGVEARLPYAIHMSMGYALCQSPQITVKDITARADQMLYQAKHQYYEQLNA